MGVLTATASRHSSPPAPTTDNVIAYSVAALLVLLSLAGAWRSTRLGVRVASDGAVTIRGIARTENLRAAQIVESGFGRTSYGRCLYLIDRKGRPHLVLGVSHPPRQKPSPPATEVLRQIRAATVATAAGRHGSADPLPLLPVAPRPATSDRPAPSTLEKPMLAGLIQRTLPGLLDSAVAALLVFVGFQAALPHTFPWILCAAVVLFVLFGVGPIVIAAVVLTRVGRISLATGDASVSLRVGKRWQTLDLRELVGVGASRSVNAIGPFIYPTILTSIVLVDREGHRMNLARLLASARVISHIRDSLSDGVTVTPLAATLLSD